MTADQIDQINFESSVNLSHAIALLELLDRSLDASTVRTSLTESIENLKNESDTVAAYCRTIMLQKRMSTKPFTDLLGAPHPLGHDHSPIQLSTPTDTAASPEAGHTNFEGEEGK